MNRLLWIAILMTSTGLLLAIFQKALWLPQPAKFVSTHVLSPQPETRQAPVFVLSDREEQSFCLSDLKGWFVLVNFWATWCEPCKDELPHLAVLARTAVDLPLRLVLVSVDDGWEAIDQLVAQLEISGQGSHPSRDWQDVVRLLRGRFSNTLNLLDSHAQVPKRFGTTKYPETYLIDSQGNLLYRFVGAKPWGHPQAMEFIKKAMESTRPSKA